MTRARRRGKGSTGTATSAGALLAAGFLAIASGLFSCGPDLVFDNPCDRASPAFDACACKECQAPSTCVEDPTDEVLGVTCQCGHAAGWCVDQELCCAASQVCHAVAKECCTPQCGDRKCGDDGCGNESGCGTCDEAGGFTCVPAGQCLFTACDGKDCGPNGQGGSCGSCAAGRDCVEGKCVAP